MKRKFIGILLTSVLVLSTVAGTGHTQIYADNLSADYQENTTDVPSAKAGGYIESELDNNAPAYDSGISLLSETPSAFPDNMSVFEDKYPDVRNQNPYGTCWAFASIGLTEFDLINDGTADKNIDLSELQLAYNTYNFETDPLGGTEGDVAKYYNTGRYTYLDRGGNFEFASRRLAQWISPTAESNVPYSKAENSITNGIDETYAYSDDSAHLKNAYLINMDTNRTDVKNAIMEHGAVGAMYYHSNSGFSYNSNLGRYVYYDTNRSGGGHAVMIVGWDDNFSRDNFTGYYEPQNDGAWLIRNSWGAWSGYFWMSYETASLSTTAWVFDVVSAEQDNVDNNYQLDGGVYTYPTSAPVVANVFTVQQNDDENYYEKLKEVSISCTQAADVHYKIEVYTDLTNKNNPVSGTKHEEATTEGNTTFAGIYTIPLESPVDLEPGTLFSIVVTPDKKSVDQEQGESVADGDTMIWENQVSRYNYKSFYSYDGSSFGCAPGGNYCIKAFTSTEDRNAKPQNQLDAKGYSIDLTDTIGANLYAALSSDILGDTGAKVRFTYPDGTYVDKPLSDFETTDYNGESVKKITYKSVPAKLNEKVDISIIKTDGSQSNSFAFSPADYLYGKRSIFQR